MPPTDHNKQRPLTPAQRYLLAILNQDGELRIVAGVKLVRNNGAHAGFMASARRLVARGLARYAGVMERLVATDAGRAKHGETGDA